MGPAVHWLRRDLRLDDNPALDAALRWGEGVVPAFVLDDHYLTADFSPPRLAFLAESLRDLEAALAAKGSRLIVRKGPPEVALPALAREAGASAVFAHEDHEPYPRRRDERVAAALAEQGTRFVTVRDLLKSKIAELGENLVIRRFVRYAVGEEI